MILLDYVIIAFMVMEGLNVGVLYFYPNTMIGNGMGVFLPFQKAQEKETERLLTRYLVCWVANVKSIFIVLLGLIVGLGNEPLKIATCVGLIFSIALYYVWLHPIIKKLDEMGEIAPKGYSKVLFWMISSFMLMFTVALCVYLFPLF